MTVIKQRLSPEEREDAIRHAMRNKGLSREEAEDITNEAEWCAQNHDKLCFMHIRCMMEVGVPIPFIAFCHIGWNTVGRKEYALQRQAEQN